MDVFMLREDDVVGSSPQELIDPAMETHESLIAMGNSIDETKSLLRNFTS